MSSQSQNEDRGLTLTVLGCGTMGIAILSGILSSLASPNPPDYSTTAPTTTSPTRIPARFIACVKRPQSVKKITTALGQYKEVLTTLVDQNLKGVQQADVIVLACEPSAYREILDEEWMKSALAGKMLISILAGVKASQIEEHLYGSVSLTPDKKRCRIVSVLPNTASAVRESMTYVAESTPPLSDEQSALVDWIFGKIGNVVHLPAHLLTVATAMCGSGIAFMAVVMEAMADGAVSMGVPRAEAYTMAAQVMRGASSMVLNGEHPAVVKDKVCTPGGCTIAGVVSMEENRVRGSIAGALRKATEVASGLGKPRTS